MITLKCNNFLVQTQETEYSTESGIIMDQDGDKFIDRGVLIQDAQYKHDENSKIETVPAGATIIYSKNKIIPIFDGVGVVEYHNVIGWELKD